MVSKGLGLVAGALSFMATASGLIFFLFFFLVLVSPLLLVGLITFTIEAVSLSFCLIHHRRRRHLHPSSSSWFVAGEYTTIAAVTFIHHLLRFIIILA
ncbi:hypothetical protein Hanom_Chr16g01452731 [Helianthus anomalus]